MSTPISDNVLEGMIQAREVARRNRALELAAASQSSPSIARRTYELDPIPGETFVGLIGRILDAEYPPLTSLVEPSQPAASNGAFVEPERADASEFPIAGSRYAGPRQDHQGQVLYLADWAVRNMLRRLYQAAHTGDTTVVSQEIEAIIDDEGWYKQLTPAGMLSDPWLVQSKGVADQDDTGESKSEEFHRRMNEDDTQVFPVITDQGPAPVIPDDYPYVDPQPTQVGLPAIEDPGTSQQG